MNAKCFHLAELPREAVSFAEISGIGAPLAAPLPAMLSDVDNDSLTCDGPVILPPDKALPPDPDSHSSG